MGDVLKDAVAEVCKYTPKDQEQSIGWKSLQKFYSRMLGERDYSLFEAVHIGLGLPLMYSLMPVVSLNTLGGRAMKTEKQLEGCKPDDPVEWKSKLDQFDDRLQLVRRSHKGQSATAVAARTAAEAEVRDVSLYEFYDKHKVERGRLLTPQKSVALMVSPGFSADAASVVDSRHEGYARMCVVAFWRLMPTERRYRMIEAVGLDADVRRWGGSVFDEPSVHAGAALSEMDRYLGIRDLVMAFDGRRTREVTWCTVDGVRRAKMDSTCNVKYGWRYALLEMLVDPVLAKWVPCWIKEQYRRWNDGFDGCVAEALAEDETQAWSNRQVLRRVMQKLRRAARKRARRVEGESGNDDASEGDDVAKGGGGVGGRGSCRCGGCSGRA